MKKPKAIIMDLDGTLAILNGRNPYDASTCEKDGVNQILLDFLNEFIYAQSGKDNMISLLIVTGRMLKDREPTERWLAKHNVPYQKLYMRPNGYRESAVTLKRLIYQNTIREQYDVILAFEDSWRNADMFRENGVPCWQVNRDPMFEKKEAK